LDRTEPIKLRQDGINAGMPAGWPRRNDGKAGSQDRHQSRNDGCLERRDEGHVGGLSKKDRGQEPREAEIRTDLEEVKAIESEVNQEKVEAVTEHQEVHKEEAMVETIEALEDREGDWHLAVGRHRQLKKWAQSDGGSWKKLAAVRRQMTLYAMVIKVRQSRRDDGRVQNATME
jgi:hypothetical protein